MANASHPRMVSTRYQIQDLKVLEMEKSYREFFSHAKDVLPSKRNKAWKKMVQSMAMDFLNVLKLTKGNLSQQDYKTVLNISKWAALKEDEFFIKNRDFTLIQYYDYCFKNKEYNTCYNMAYDFYKKYKTHPEFGYDFIKNVSKNIKIDNAENDFHINYQLKLWPFIDGLVKSSISEFYCAQSPLKETIEQKILQESFKGKHFAVLNLIHPDCWKVIKNNFITTLFQYTDAYSRKKVFKALKDNVRLGTTDTYFYTILQLLSGINLSPKETLEYWKRMHKISKNYLLREKLLARLKSYIPLPGNVFLGVTKQQKIISRALAKYFPEYIDFYATTCIDHLSGKVETQGGNPATHCHDLFKLSRSVDLLPKAKIYQYTKLTTF